MMRTTKLKKIFAPFELEKAKKELLYERLNLLPVEVKKDGYYYDFSEFNKSLKIKHNDNPASPDTGSTSIPFTMYYGI